MAGNPKCKYPEHLLHICALKEAGLNGKSCKAIAELAKDPKFRCETCGATAKIVKYLCNPKKI